MGVYDIIPDEWIFYAVTVTPEGVACFCQGQPDGQFYWIVDGSIKDANLASGMTWNIGQDGSAAYRYNLQGDIDACLADLEVCGVIYADVTDPLIVNAVKLYCRSTNTDDPAKAAEWLRRYEALKSCLMMAEGYGWKAGADE
jgi:hypothetical protein